MKALVEEGEDEEKAEERRGWIKRGWAGQGGTGIGDGRAGMYKTDWWVRVGVGYEGKGRGRVCKERLVRTVGERRMREGVVRYGGCLGRAWCKGRVVWTVRRYVGVYKRKQTSSELLIHRRLLQ